MTDFEDEEFDVDSDEAEYQEMIKSWEDDKANGGGSIPELYFSRPDPYAKPDPLPDDQPRRDYRIDEQGRIVAQLQALALVEDVTDEILDRIAHGVRIAKTVASDAVTQRFDGVCGLLHAMEAALGSGILYNKVFTYI